MRKPSFLLLVSILMFSTLAITQPTSANFSVDVYINDAFYDDLDDDGKEDDIQVDISIFVNNFKVYTDIEIYVGITLPSGMDFWFVYEFTAVKYSFSGTTNMKWDLMNTALESGWYQADAVGFADGEKFSYMDSLVFDPPGGQTDKNPLGFVAFY